MPSRRLEFNFTGDTSDLDRAFREVTRRAEAQERQIARLERRQREYQAQLRRTSSVQRTAIGITQRQTTVAAESGASTTAWITSLVAAAAAVAPAAAAAAVSVSGFAAVAAPAIIKVLGAQEDLTASWDTLDRRQQVSSLLVRQLADDYQTLADSYEPQALAEFNSVVLAAQTQMPRLKAVVDASGFAVTGLGDKIGGFVSGPEMTRFIQTAGQYAPRALGQLGDAAVELGGTVTALGTALIPTSYTLLTATRGVLGMANAAAHINPLLTELVVTSLLLRAPTLALTGLFTRAASGVRTFATETRGASLASRAIVLPGGGFTTYRGEMRNFATEAGRASRASRVLTAATKFAPAAFVAAAVGLSYLVIRMNSAADATDGMIGRLQAETKAFGNNLQGRQALVEALQRQIQVRNQQIAVERRGQFIATNEITRQTKAVEKLTDKQREQLSAIRNIEAGQNALSKEFGISAESANRLATAAGVDMSEGILKSGEITADARKKITNYRLAVEQAANRTTTISLALEQAGDSALSMKDRINGLNAALEAEFAPSLAAFDATTQLKQGFAQLADQLGKTKGSMDSNSASALALRQQFASQLTNVANLRTALLQQTGSLEKANGAAVRYLPILYAMAGGSKDARAQVDALARTMGFNIGQTQLSRGEFMRLASSMNISRAQANLLWKAYQRLTASTRTGSVSLTTYIQRTTSAAAAARVLAVRTGAGDQAQNAYNSRVRQALPVLYALAGNNKAARAQVDALARATANATHATNVSRSAFLRAADAMGIGKKRAAELWRELQKIKSRKVSVDVDGRGKWVIAHDSVARRFPGEARAMGGPIPAHAALGPGGPTSDDVPTWLSVGEHVITAREVRAAGGHDAIYRMRAAILRGDMQGFARGGAVSLTGGRSTSKTAAAVVAPINAGINEMIAAIAQQMAAQWKKYLGAGGPVVAAARTQIGVPYVWGGTAWGRGLDCSGLTSGAWMRGAGVWIGRTTYDQYPHSTRIGVPRPGALGFPHLGHVVLATGRGTIIEAPYTGARVREVGISRHYDWRWPNAARRAEGGPIERSYGEDFVRTGRHADRVAIAMFAGDPGLLKKAAMGGLQVGQGGYALGPTLIGERGTGGEAYIPLAPDRRQQSEALLADVAQRFGGIYAKRVPAGAGARGGATEVHKHVTNQIMPGAQVTVAEPVDIDMLAQRLEFHLIASQQGS